MVFGRRSSFGFLVTRNLAYLCTPERGEELREKRPAIDWHREKPMLKYTIPYTAKVDKSMGQIRTTQFGVEVLRKLNQELMLSSHRRSSGCRISNLSRFAKAPSIFFTDGRGFVLAEYVLRELDSEMPFHPIECDVLNLLNI